jgi:hypothetical protein
MNKKMVDVFSNMSFIMCHVFIKDKTKMPLLIHIYESSFDEQLTLNNQYTNE